VVFDLKTLARRQEIKRTGGKTKNPDAILYDAASQRVFHLHGLGRHVTAVDASTPTTVLGTIALEPNPVAVSDGKGRRVYVNLRTDTSRLIDPQKLSVISVWPISGWPGSLRAGARGRRTTSVSRVAITMSWRSWMPPRARSLLAPRRHRTPGSTPLHSIPQPAWRSHRSAMELSHGG